ncbi:hypothetical protein D3C80_1254470 [compost metagenome]
MRACQQLLDAAQDLGADAEAGEVEADGLPVEQAHHHRFAEAGGYGGHPQVELAPLHAQHDPAILRQAALGDVQAGHDLQARNDRRGIATGWCFALEQHAIDPVAHLQLAFKGLDVDVRGALIDGMLQHQVDHAHHRRLGRHVLEMLDIAIADAFVVQRLDQCAHGRTTSAVSLFDQPGHLFGSGDDRLDSFVGVIAQRRQCVGRQRNGSRHAQVAGGLAQGNHAMVTGEPLGDSRRHFYYFVSQACDAEQVSVGGCHLPILDRPQAQQRVQFFILGNALCHTQPNGALYISRLQCACT